MLTHCDLFSGIGGFSLASQHLGFQTTQFVELNPYCQEVLRKNFQGVPIHGDVATFQPTEVYDLLTSGFPCQPFSLAGKQLGSVDSRALWHETSRVIQQTKPTYVVLENVKGLLYAECGSYIRGILRGLDRAGYTYRVGTISVSGVGGVHKRERLFILAYSALYGWRSPRCPDLEERTTEKVIPRTVSPNMVSEGVQNKSSVCRSDYGVPYELDCHLMKRDELNLYVETGLDNEVKPNRKERLRALGNAVCPQVAAIAINACLALKEKDTNL